LLEEISWRTLTVAQKMRDRLSLIEAVDFREYKQKNRDSSRGSHARE